MGNIRLYGSTSGYTELAPPAVAPDGVLSLPSGTGTLATTADSGLQIVSPTSIANSGGSASASGGQVSFTGVNTISLNGVFSSSFENYLLVVSASGSTDNNALIRFRSAGADNTSASYGHQRLIVDGSTVSGSRSTGQSNSVWGNISTSGIGINHILIGSPFDSGKPTFGRSATNSPYLGVFIQDSAFTFASNTSFDGFTLYNTSGTITGTIRVYGYRNA